MKKILLALHNYKSEHGRFPPAVVYDPSGKPMHSWRVLILPYLGEHDLFDQYDHSHAWDSPQNQKLRNAMPDVFRCPSHGHHGNELAEEYTNYVWVQSTNAESEKTRSDDSMQNPQGRSILLSEVNHRSVVWTSPNDMTDSEFLDAFANHETSHEEITNHPGSLVVGFDDGSVRTLSAFTDIRTVSELLTGVDDISIDRSPKAVDQ